MSVEGVVEVCVEEITNLLFLLCLILVLFLKGLALSRFTYLQGGRVIPLVIDRFSS